MAQKIRFLLSRDDWYHQRGYWVIAKTLRNAGIEVVLGGTQTPEDVVHTAVQEGVDIIGYRIMDAAPKIIVPILLEKLEQEGAEGIPVVVGGIIPKKEEKMIKAMGVKEVFHPYSPMEQIVERITAIAADARVR